MGKLSPAIFKTTTNLKTNNKAEDDCDPTLPEELEDSMSSMQGPLPRREVAPQHATIHSPEDDPMRWSLPPDRTISKDSERNFPNKTNTGDVQSPIIGEDDDDDDDDTIYLSDPEEDVTKPADKVKNRRGRSKSPKRARKSPKRIGKSPKPKKAKSSKRAKSPKRKAKKIKKRRPSDVLSISSETLQRKNSPEPTTRSRSESPTARKQTKKNGAEDPSSFMPTSPKSPRRVRSKSPRRKRKPVQKINLPIPASPGIEQKEETKEKTIVQVEEKETEKKPKYETPSHRMEELNRIKAKIKAKGKGKRENKTNAEEEDEESKKKTKFKSPLNRMEELNRIKAKVKARKAKKKASKKKKPPQDFQSFAEIDMLPEQNKNNKKKKGIIGPQDVASTTNFLKDTLLRNITRLDTTVKRLSGSGRTRRISEVELAQPRLSDPCIPPEEVQAIESPPDSSKDSNDSDEEQAIPLSSRPLQEIKKKGSTKMLISKMRTFAIMNGRLNQQKEFLDAFNGAVEESDDEDEDTNAATMAARRKKKEASLDRLMTQLQEYEAKLDQERKDLSEENVKYQLKQESAEQLLNEEIRKSEELEMEIEQLREELNQACESAIVEELKQENRILETKVELLQQKNDRHQQTISSMMIAEKSEIKRRLSSSSSNRSSSSINYLLSPGVRRGPSDKDSSTREYSYLSTPSTLRRKALPPPPALGDEGSMLLKLDDDYTQHDDDVNDDSSTVDGDAEPVQSGLVSMAAMTGELLQLQFTLSRRDAAFEEQAKVLGEVKQELETLKEARGVQNLQKHVQNLEDEKKFFVSEISKLKKELDASGNEVESVTELKDTKSSSYSTPQRESLGWLGSVVIAGSSYRDRAPRRESRGWFGFGGSSINENGRTMDIVNDLNGTKADIIVQITHDVIKEEESMRKMSSFLDEL